MRTIPAGHPPVFGALAVAGGVADVALAAGVAFATAAPEPSGTGVLPRAPVAGGDGCAGRLAPAGGLAGPAGGAGASTVPPQALTEAKRHAVIRANCATPIVLAQSPGNSLAVRLADMVCLRFVIVTSPSRWVPRDLRANALE